MKEVRLDNVAALQDWAKRWCHGWTVKGLANALGVDPSIEAISDYLSYGLTGNARKAVVDVCHRELNRTGKTRESKLSQ